MRNGDIKMDIKEIIHELSLKRPAFHSEKDFQLALAWQIREYYEQQKHDDLEIYLERRFDFENGNQAHVDISFSVDDMLFPFELKHKTMNHGARPLGRYLFLQDIERLENITKIHNCIGLNYVSFGSGQGYDLLNITVEDGTGFRKINTFNPVELKWRTRNSRDWLIPSNIKRQMTSSFRESIKKLYAVDNLPVGAYKVSKKGDLEFIPNTGFGMYTTFGRGNDGITKLDKFNEQLNELAGIWEKCNVGSVFPLHELVPNSNAKTLQESLIN
ncbi:unnamed protein product, partial [marine sediment metagenome]